MLTYTNDDHPKYNVLCTRHMRTSVTVFVAVILHQIHRRVQVQEISNFQNKKLQSFLHILCNKGQTA